MSWATCYKGSNNIHFNLPPLMSDGRNFSTLTPMRQENTNLFEKLNMQTNYDYRQYLIKNAEKIMKNNQSSACDNCCHCETIVDNIPSHQKYFYRSCSDLNKPYGYEDSDLKNMYLSRTELNSQLKAPILTGEKLLQMRSRRQTDLSHEHMFQKH
tara:strand:+ start:604 stop:1068 length:465 start_codon:yes stop_codon:yes gene_type:complete